MVMKIGARAKQQKYKIAYGAVLQIYMIEINESNKAINLILNNIFIVYMIILIVVRQI